MPGSEWDFRPWWRQTARINWGAERGSARCATARPPGPAGGGGGAGGQAGDEGTAAGHEGDLVGETDGALGQPVDGVADGDVLEEAGLGTPGPLGQHLGVDAGHLVAGPGVG